MGKKEKGFLDYNFLDVIFFICLFLLIIEAELNMNLTSNLLGKSLHMISAIYILIYVMAFLMANADFYFRKMLAFNWKSLLAMLFFVNTAAFFIMFVLSAAFMVDQDFEQIFEFNKYSSEDYIALFLGGIFLISACMKSYFQHKEST